VITVGDGGVITTNNADWDKLFRLWRQHAMNVPDTVRHHSNRIIFEQYPMCGFNYRLTDVQAAIGREQLKRLAEIVARRREVAQEYGQLLRSEVPQVELPAEPEWAQTNWQSYCVRLPAKVDQRAVMQHMLDRGVSTRRGIMCIHREQAYADLPCPWPLTQSERAQDECILLPLFPQMTSETVREVVGALQDAIAHARSQPAPADA
jgi:dTDP-4-amino-4,6-dideoxygalactose transaminase